MKKNNKLSSKVVTFLGFGGPSVILFSCVVLLPFIYGIYLTFTGWDGISSKIPFVGFENYSRLFQDKEFWVSLGKTILYALISVILANVVAFLLAYLVTSKIKGSNFFRAAFFTPNLIGGIVLGYIWQLIINGVLAFFKTTLTVKASYGFWGMVIAMNWQMIGYMMVIYIAAIQNISEDVKEAALIDGVNRRQMVTKIILPLIMPAITICLFMTTTNAFKMFDLNLALTAGLPGKSTSLVALDIYNSFYNRMGYEGIGQAKAVLFLLIVAAISVTQLVVTRRKEVES